MSKEYGGYRPPEFDEPKVVELQAGNKNVVENTRERQKTRVDVIADTYVGGSEKTLVRADSPASVRMQEVKSAELYLKAIAAAKDSDEAYNPARVLEQTQKRFRELGEKLRVGEAGDISPAEMQVYQELGQEVIRLQGEAKEQQNVIQPPDVTEKRPVQAKSKGFFARVRGLFSK